MILGIKPTRPDVGYGYVRFGRREGRADGQEIYQVEKFTEKPALPLARRYLASGKYRWNGGMFVWRAISAPLRTCETGQVFFVSSAIF